MKRYGPADPLQSPRFAGVSTFLRLQHTPHLDGVDVAFVGLPFDTDASLRGGARFGPKAIREASLEVPPFYNPAHRVAVFERISAIDYGDAPVVSGFTDRTFDRIQEALEEVHAAGTTPICFGGEHGVLLPELRAAASAHGPLSLILFGARVAHVVEDRQERLGGLSPARQAVEEGLVDPSRSTLMGARGGLYGRSELDDDRELGFTVFSWDDLAQLGSGAVAAAVDRAAGEAFLSFDIGFVDPAFAPGTVAPVCGGPTSMQALALLRACRGLRLVGADVVEVVPDLDSSRLTAMLAATVAWEILSLVAAERQEEAL
jgi:agmatinase